MVSFQDLMGSSNRPGISYTQGITDELRQVMAEVK